MLLRHATLARNVNSILQRGLLCRKSKGRLKVVWLHSRSRSHWALSHTVGRHGGRVDFERTSAGRTRFSFTLPAEVSV